MTDIHYMRFSIVNIYFQDEYKYTYEKILSCSFLTLTVKKEPIPLTVADYYPFNNMELY